MDNFRLLPLASHYSAVVEWCEIGEVSDIGLVIQVFSCPLILICFFRLVNQALAAAIEELVHDYRLLVCQLEQGINSGLSLHQLWFHLQVVTLILTLRTLQTPQGSLHSMELLHQLVTAVESRKATGGATLAILHDSLVHCSGNPRSEKILHYLVELASKPFFETLSKWLYRFSQVLVISSVSTYCRL